MEHRNGTKQVGGRIKYIRKERGLTLQQLSESSGLSIGYLSNLERDINSPTLDHLQRICEVLDINIIELLEKSSEGKMHLKEHERRVIYEKKGSIKYELITEGERDIEGICIKMKAGVDYENVSWGHTCDELGIIIKGTMEIRTMDCKYILEEGDTFYLNAKTRHTFRNIGEGECVSYWISSDYSRMDE
ncbi:helix-turn-helix domain-containing protein [Anaeromicrobium sediminis]|nr:XRE family transcriptional regulator [Anaeromicrobium sediminis]